MNLTFEGFRREADLARQRELFSQAFPETVGTSQLTLEHYKWKFQSAPFDPTSYEYVARSDDRLVGYYAALPYRYVIGGAQMQCGVVCDVMTHPDCRGQGIFAKLGHYSTGELRKQGIDFTTGYPIRPEVLPGHLKVGWKVGFELPIYVCPLQVNSLLNRKGLGALAPLANVALRTVHGLLARKPDLNATLAIIPSNELDGVQGYEEFLEQWAAEQSSYLIKDRDFLKWRLSAPSARYHIFTLRDRGNLVAVAIVRATTLEHIPTLVVLDLMAVSSHRSRLGPLIKAIKDFARLQGCEFVAGMFSANCARRYRLLPNGFLPSPYRFKFIYKILNDNLPIENFGTETNWHLTWIDSDQL